MALNIKIDGDRALDLLAHRVRDHEGFVYTRFAEAPSCRYQDKGAPSCLIGGALFDAGVPIEVLASFDTVSDSDDGKYGSAGAGIDEVALPEGVVITAKALRIFQRAQGAQDIGHTWGETFQIAVQVAVEFGPERSDYEVRS